MADRRNTRNTRKKGRGFNDDSGLGFVWRAGLEPGGGGDDPVRGGTKSKDENPGSGSMAADGTDGPGGGGQRD
jgi:hypothetical protein